MFHPRDGESGYTLDMYICLDEHYPLCQMLRDFCTRSRGKKLFISIVGKSDKRKVFISFLSGEERIKEKYVFFSHEEE